jgi:hypothetical protein
MTPLQRHRDKQLRQLPSETGVYVLCDLDQIPIYVGKSIDRIRARVRRHLSSARSDVIANRMIDVWEVAFVWSWPLKGKLQISELERFLYHRFNSSSRLMNGSIPALLRDLPFPEPELQKIQVLPDEEIASRKRPEHRLPRQIAQFNQLMDYILIVKDESHLRQALKAHFERLTKYYQEFSSVPAPEPKRKRKKGKGSKKPRE